MSWGRVDNPTTRMIVHFRIARPGIEVVNSGEHLSLFVGQPRTEKKEPILNSSVIAAVSL